MDYEMELPTINYCNKPTHTNNNNTEPQSLLHIFKYLNIILNFNSKFKTDNDKHFQKFCCVYCVTLFNSIKK